MAQQQDKAQIGTFLGYADGDSVRVGWSKDKTSQKVSAMIVFDDGRRMQWEGNLTDQTGRDITIGALITMGWDGTSPIGHREGDLVGFGQAKCLFTVEMNHYNGKSFPRITRVDPRSGRAHLGGDATSEELDRLNDLVRRQMSGTNRIAQRPAASAAAPQTHGGSGRPTVRQGPATAQSGPAPASALMGSIMSDEDRLRAIDQGQEFPTRPSHDEAPPEEEDIPF